MAQLFVISAPSGTGKTSLIYKILDEQVASKTKLGISCTTRKKERTRKKVFLIFFLVKKSSLKILKKKTFLNLQKFLETFMEHLKIGLFQLFLKGLTLY